MPRSQPNQFTATVSNTNKNSSLPTASSSSTVTVEGANIYITQPTNLVRPTFAGSSWFEEDDILQVARDDDDDRASCTIAATTITTSTTVISTSTSTTSQPKERKRRVGGLLFVEVDNATDKQQMQLQQNNNNNNNHHNRRLAHLVSSLHVVAGLNHTGTHEIPAGGFEPELDEHNPLRGAVREITEELRYSVLLHLPSSSPSLSLPVINSGIPCVDELEEEDEDDDDDDQCCDNEEETNSKLVAFPRNIYELAEQDHNIASIQFTCNYGREESGERQVELFGARHFAPSTATGPGFDLSQLQEIFNTTHAPINASMCLCEMKELKLIPIFAAAAAKNITSTSDIDLSPAFVECCFAGENESNSSSFASQKRLVLNQLLSWFVAPSSSSSSEAEESQQQQQPPMTKTQERKFKQAQREQRRQEEELPIKSVFDANPRMAESMLLFSVRPSPRPMQEGEMCALCYTSASHATATSTCHLASRAYLTLQLESATLLKNNAISLRWNSVGACNNRSPFGKLCSVFKPLRSKNQFISIASTTPGGDAFFAPYCNASAGLLLEAPVVARGIPQVNEVTNEETGAIGFQRRVLITEIIAKPASEATAAQSLGEFSRSNFNAAATANAPPQYAAPSSASKGFSRETLFQRFN